MQTHISIVSKYWLENERKVVERIALVLHGTTEGIHEQSIGYKWMIGIGNNWWASAIENKKIVVASRYESAEFMQSLKVVLERIFN